MTPYESGFLGRCSDLGLPPAVSSRLLRKSAGWSDNYRPELVASALGAGAGYLLSRKGRDGRRRNWLVNSLVGAAIGGAGTAVARKYMSNQIADDLPRSRELVNRSMSGELSEDAPDIQSYLRGRNSDKVREALGLGPTTPVTHRDVTAYFAKSYPGVSVNDLHYGGIPEPGTPEHSRFDVGSTANREVYEYRLAQTIDLVDRLRAMGVDEKSVEAAAAAFAKATSKPTFDHAFLPSAISRPVSLRLRSVKPEIDRSKGEIISKVLSGGR